MPPPYLREPLVAGLEKLFLLTSSNDYELRVELEAFDGSTAWAQYSNFTVDSAAHSYTLHVSGYTGTAGQLSLIHI